MNAQVITLVSEDRSHMVLSVLLSEPKNRCRQLGNKPMKIREECNQRQLPHRARDGFTIASLGWNTLGPAQSMVNWVLCLGENLGGSLLNELEKRQKSFKDKLEKRCKWIAGSVSRCETQWGTQKEREAFKLTFFQRS